MIRVVLSAALVVATFGVDAFARSQALAPISDEFARQNPFAIAVFNALALALVYLMVACRHCGSRLLSWWIAALLPLLVLIAVTDPRTPVHLGGFLILWTAGIAWMLAYCLSFAMRGLALLIALIVGGTLAVGFILSVSSVLVDVRSISPLGLFQRVFLLLFAVLVARSMNPPVESLAPWNRRSAAGNNLVPGATDR